MNICKHLIAILNYEVSTGNSIVSIDNDAWTNAKLVITLKKPANNNYIDNTFKNNNSVEYWENKDTHYPVQKGYICKKCKCAIASPLE